MSTTSINTIIDSDLTAKPISKPELVKTLKDMTAALEIDIGNGGGGGGGTVTISGTADPGITRAQLLLTSFTDPPAALRLTGYTTPGDYGGGLYIKKASEPNHEGKAQSADGTWYELVPEGGAIWIEQFGGLPVTGDWTSKDIDASTGANAAVDYLVFSGHGPCDLCIGPGVFYFSKTVQLKGAGFNLRGMSSFASSATFLRPEKNVDLFIGHHFQWSFEKDGGVYYNGRTCQVGEKCYFQEGSGITHTYIVSAVTGTATVTNAWGVSVPVGSCSSDGSQKPTTTGTGIVDGTVVWDYYRESTRVERTNSGWDGLIENLYIYSHWDRSVDPYGTAIGFLGRSRAHLRNCWIGNMSHHGAAFVANGDPELPFTTGNVNGWRIETCAFYYNGCDGYHIGYSDANAGTAMHIDCSQNGRWAGADWSFLGDNHYSLQTAYDGLPQMGVAKKAKGCCHNGALWLAVLPVIGTQPWKDWNNIEPGTDDSVWYLFWTDAGHTATPSWNWPDWATNKVVNPNHTINVGGFEAGGGFCGNNLNARNRWDGVYGEGSDSYCQFGARDFVTGGLNQQFIFNGKGFVFYDGSWYCNLTSRTFSRDYTTGRSKDYGVTLGYGDGLQNTGVLGFTDYFGGTTQIGWLSPDADGYDHKDLIMTYQWGYQDWVVPFRLTGPRTAFTGGKIDGSGNPVTVGMGAMALKQLFVGSQGRDFQRQIDIGDISYTTTGYHARGEIVFNIDAAAGGPMGWMCVTSGAPGVWKAMPNLAA